MDDLQRIDLRLYCTAAEFAELHGVTKQAVAYWIEHGRIKARHAVGRVWILRSTPRPVPRKPGPAAKTA